MRIMPPEGSVIEITLNGETRYILPISLEKLLADLGLAAKHLAIALNDAVVPASLRGVILLADGDRVEIIQPAAGG